MTLTFQVRVFFLTFILSALSLSAYSQKDSPKKLKNNGEEYYRVQEYGTALKYLLKYDSLEPGDKEINYKIGYSYFNTRRRRQALPYLLIAEKSDKRMEDIDYLLARTFHINHQFEKALEYYSKALSDIPKNVEKEARKGDIDRQIEKTNYAKNQIANPKEYDILNMGDVINTPYPDYVPVVSADETVLIFTSRRPDTQGGGKDPLLNEWWEDLYLTEKKDGEWESPRNMGPVVNSEEHDASIGLSPDGQKLFVYRSAKSSVGKLVAGDIYVSNLRGADWSKTTKMGPQINSNSWEPSASISADENTLYFASDRDGGYGGTDIYVVKRLPNGEWADAQNAGETINTPFDDDAPFIHPDGKRLYFASKGHKGMGGFDIFEVEREKEGTDWGTPVNVGYPINTADDDIYIVWSADGSRGYFSSIRDDGQGDLDIYVVNKGLKTVPLVILKGHVYDRKTGDPLGATITITDNKKQVLTGIYNSNPRSGKYTVILESGYDYGIAVDAVDHLFYSENLRVPDQNEYYEGIKDFRLSPIQKGRKIILRNIFFDIGKADLRQESITELKRVVEVMNEFPTLFIEIGGHTDADEGTSSAKNLSQTRAVNVVDFLYRNGIDSTRMYGYGYGDEFPLSERKDELGRQLNRRTEFLIVDERNREGYIANNQGYYDLQKKKDPTFNLIGSEEPLLVMEGRSTNSFDLVKNLEKKGLAGLVAGDSVNSSGVMDGNNSATALATDKTINWKKLTVKQIDSLRVSMEREKQFQEEMARMEGAANAAPKSEKINKIDKSDANEKEPAPYASGITAEDASKFDIPADYRLPQVLAKEFNEIYTLNMVFFDSDKSNIKASEAWKLDRVAETFKKVNGGKLRLVGHTDSQNTLNYNYKLSQRRAEEAKAYLIRKGITADKIRIEYKSSTSPIATNIDSDGRAVNRRVELFVE